MYIYIYIYIHTCIHTYIHTYIYIYVCVCIRVCVCVYIYIYIYYTVAILAQGFRLSNTQGCLWGWVRPSRERWLRPPLPATSSTPRPVLPRPGPPRPVSRLGIVPRDDSVRATGWLLHWLGLALGSERTTDPPIRWEVGMAGQGRGSRVLNARQSLGCMWILALILAGTVAVAFPLGGRDLCRRTRTKEPRVQWMLRRPFRGSWILASVKVQRRCSPRHLEEGLPPSCSQAGCGHRSGFAESLQGCSGERRGQVPA